jgi:predicted HTH transcriptional regulator
MLKGTTANRMTKIKVCESGKTVKTISNVSINFGQDFEQLKKMIEISIRLSPQDPLYIVDKVFILNQSNQKEIEFNQMELEQLQSALFRPENQSLTTKITLSVLEFSEYTDLIFLIFLLLLGPSFH